MSMSQPPHPPILDHDFPPPLHRSWATSTHHPEQALKARWVNARAAAAALKRNHPISEEVRRHAELVDSMFSAFMANAQLTQEEW
jgi:hypothetical protein